MINNCTTVKCLAKDLFFFFNYNDLKLKKKYSTVGFGLGLQHLFLFFGTAAMELQLWPNYHILDDLIQNQIMFHMSQS
jgi:hypothetical protein